MHIKIVIISLFSLLTCSVILQIYAYNNKNNIALSDIDVISEERYNSDDCRKLHYFSTLNRKKLSLPINNEEFKKIEHELNSFLLPNEKLTNEEGDIFLGLDIDNDGIDDSVKRFCGSGVGRLCTISIVFSRTGKLIDEEFVGNFYLARININTYLISETYGEFSPYTNKDITSIYRITPGSLEEICK